MRRREPLAPDMTPLVDVVFLLLIFFLVSTSFKKEELALLLNLPASEAAVQTIKKEEVNIELSEDAIALKGKPVTFEALDALLAAVTDKSSPVNVRIDKSVRYERIVRLLDLLKKHDLNNLALINETQK
jgi:biopolymer transport protein ExbD